MLETTNKCSKKNIDVEKENNSIRKEVKKLGYDVFSANADTVKICLENELKKPISIPNDHESFYKKIMKIR